MAVAVSISPRNSAASQPPRFLHHRPRSPRLKYGASSASDAAQLLDLGGGLLLGELEHVVDGDDAEHLPAGVDHRAARRGRTSRTRRRPPHPSRWRECDTSGRSSMSDDLHVGIGAAPGSPRRRSSRSFPLVVDDVEDVERLLPVPVASHVSPAPRRRSSSGAERHVLGRHVTAGGPAAGYPSSSRVAFSSSG